MKGVLSQATMYGVAIALAVVVFVVFTSRSPEAKIDKDDPIFSRDMVGYEFLPIGGEGEVVVKYEYKGAALPEKLAPDEDVSKRTTTSYARLIAIEDEGTKEERRTYNGIFYTRPTFVQEGETWYYIEHATTTETAFNKKRTQSGFLSLLWRTAYAADIFSGAGDGYASETVSGYSDGCSMALTWDVSHDGAGDTSGYTETTFDATITTEYSPEPGTDPDSCSVFIRRAFVPFVTSSIPSDATISAATLNVYVTAKVDDDNDGTDYITVVQTTQAAHDSLVNGDYDACGAIDNPTEGVDSGQRKDITSISTSAYLVFTLNATGLGWIKKSGQTSNCGVTSGVTCLGIREGHDTTDAQLVSNTTNSVTMSSSEATGTTQDPYLSVTYTEGAKFAFWQLQDY